MGANALLTYAIGQFRRATASATGYPLDTRSKEHTAATEGMSLNCSSHAIRLETRNGIGCAVRGRGGKQLAN